MIITPSAVLANATASLWLTHLQAGAAASTLSFYTGAKPANTLTGPDGTTQILLGTATCKVSGNDVGSVASNRLTFDTITQDSAADNTGTATWVRIRDGDGLAVIDVDVSDLGGNGFMKMNTTAIVAGGPIAVSSCFIDF